MLHDRFEWAMDADTSPGAIGPWLESLGLGRYRQVFIAQEIDLQILPDLSEAELASLGIPLGPRKKILNAVRALRGGAAPRNDRHGSDGPERSSSPGRGPERRNLTVLTCDMVNSTALATQLDPEQLREVMHPYFDACSDVVDRFGGFVAKYTGDGLMAYFGYPAAEEDAAERAVRASLQMIEVVRDLEPRPGITLQTRIGIATGLTVVGDLIGKGAAREEAVVGAVPALAARLQALAHPDGILISNATRRLVRGIFKLEDLGRRELKGFPQRPRVWGVLGKLRAESRFAAAHGDRQTGLIDRDAELALLLDRWRLACTGAGQLVMLSGEAGLGKSRLINAVRENLTGKAHDVVLLQCSNYSRNSAFYPVIEWLERAVQLTLDDTSRSKLSKLQAKLALPTEALGRIAELLSISTDLVDPAAEPSVRKEQLLAALVGLLIGTASGSTRLLVLEDAHWSDASTLELLGRIIAGLAPRRVLLIVTYRPEFTVPWPPEPFTTKLVLDRLEQRHCLQLVARLADGEGLTPELRSHIVDRAEGVPLFVEELTKSVLESGLATENVERSDGKFRLAVPATLHDTLMARLDRLASVKVIAQTAAALGREFPYRMLAASTGLGGRRLQHGLVQLAAAGLLLCNGQPPDATYTFNHALVRDVAYNSMLLSRRAALHAEIARMLETKFAEAVTMQPEVLAHHYTEAGLLDLAIPLWQRAGDRALGQSAHVEATSHLETALTLLAKQAERPERDQLEIALRFRLIAPLVVTTGFASPQSEENYSRIAQLTEQAGSTIEALRVLWGQAAMALVRSVLSKADALGDRFLRLAAQANLKNGPSLGHALIAYCALVRGDIRRAFERFDIAMQELDLEESRSVFDDWPYDILAALTSQRILALQQQGSLDQAMRQAEEALAEARRVGSPGTEGYVLMHIALANMIAGDVHRANLAATAWRRLADDADIQYYRWHEEVVLGWVEAKSGALDQGIERIRHGLELRHKRMANLWVPVYVLSVAELLMAHGRHEEAFPIFSECERLCSELQQSYIEPELHRLRAVAFAATGAARATVEASFDLALQTARDRGAKLFELRAATSRARFWQRSGRNEAASALLAPVLAGFTEGFASADVQEAQAVLAELASAR
jgi:class 3 adenylate cyclase/tetratricopeptide (TPR) repeat protein